jgi:hypothetical protein
MAFLVVGVALLAAAGVRGAASETPAAAGAVDVVRTAHALPALSLVSTSDLIQESVPASAIASAGLTRAQAVGRRLLVGVPAGSLLTAPMLSAAGQHAAGVRDIRLVLDALHVAPSVGPGQEAELVSIAAPTGADTRPPRAEVVAIVHVVDLSALTPPSNGGSVDQLGGSPRASDTTHGGQSSVVVTLTCETACALRVALAVDSSHSLRLFAHPPGDPVPQPVELGGR